MQPVIDLKILDARLASALPGYATPGSAALDLRACIDQPIVLEPGQAELISTGMSVHLKDPGLAGLILPRSGLGAKHGIALGNLVGLLDSDYTGPLKMSIWNRSATAYTINPMDRVAQLVIVPIVQVEFNVISDDHAQTVRGEGGFASTGIA